MLPIWCCRVEVHWAPVTIMGDSLGSGRGGGERFLVAGEGQELAFPNGLFTHCHSHNPVLMRLSGLAGARG